MSHSVSPPVIHSAMHFPMPPPPPKPCMEEAAANHRPRTVGQGPSRGPASGVKASGWATRRIMPASPRKGKRPMASSSMGAKRSRSLGTSADSCFQGTPSIQQTSGLVSQPPMR